MRVQEGVAQFEDLAVKVTTACATRAARAGPASSVTDALVALCVSVGSAQPRAVGQWLVERCRAVLSLLPSQAATLSDCSEWQELMVLIKFLGALAFEDNLHLRELLPDVWHVAFLCAVAGSSADKRAVAAVFSNTLQAMVRSSGRCAACLLA